MTRKSVQSGQIAAIGFDPISQTLEVEFHPTRKQQAAEEPGSIYQYGNITPGDYARLTEAESIGGHFGQHIRAFPKLFPFKKIS